MTRRSSSSKKTALNPATAGTVQNIGLMAQKAEEYGSHPTTFEIPADGVVKMVLEDGTVLHEHAWRRAISGARPRARKAPIEDWVNLAIDRQAATGYRAIFWLDATAPMMRS
jgi:isocitrate dehydrogenase